MTITLARMEGLGCYRFVHHCGLLWIFVIPRTETTRVGFETQNLMGNRGSGGESKSI
jgi:hypothetical protein